jgi:DNA mismatch repair protein MutH
MNFIKGTQNQGGQYMQLNEKVDHSKAAFYSIEVTGENILKVQRGRS